MTSLLCRICWLSIFILCCARSAAAESGPLTAAEAGAYAKALALPGVNAEILGSVTVCRDLEYARPDGHALRLDLYLPANRPQPAPCVIVIAGGGFLAQDRTRFGFVAAYLAARGFAAACIDYRGAPDNTFPATIGDTKSAVRWVRAHAKEFALDPARIGAIGQSAGGHLAVMLAVSADVVTLEGVGHAAGVSSRIQAAVSLAGVFDFISRLKEGGHQTRALEEKRRTNGAWIGEPFSVTSERWRQASPINHVTADDAPVLFVHCRGDATAPFAQSVQMFEALQPLSPRSKLVLYDGGGHGVLRAAGTNARMWAEAIAFFTVIFASR
jgi:acetyl esterase/lipase